MVVKSVDPPLEGCYIETALKQKKMIKSDGWTDIQEERE